MELSGKPRTDTPQAGGALAPGSTPAADAATHETPALIAQLEQKLGRTLTAHEREVLSAAPLRNLATDKFEMPAVARELAAMLEADLRRMSLGTWRPSSSRPDAPLVSQARLRLLKATAGVSLPLLPWLGWNFYTTWREAAAMLPVSAATDLPVLAMLLGYALLGPVIWQYVAAVDRVVARLAGSDVLERLVSDAAGLDSIHDYTPQPWRWLVLGAPRRNLRGRLSLLTNYLDWFLGSPRTHFRIYWLVAAVLLLASPAGIALLTQGPVGGGSGLARSAAMTLVTASVAPVWMLWLVVSSGKAVNCQALLQELRRRFAHLQ